MHVRIFVQKQPGAQGNETRWRRCTGDAAIRSGRGRRKLNWQRQRSPPEAKESQVSPIAFVISCTAVLRIQELAPAAYTRSAASGCRRDVMARTGISFHCGLRLSHTSRPKAES